MQLQTGIVVSAFHEDRARVIFRDIVLGLEFRTYTWIGPGLFSLSSFFSPPQGNYSL